MSADESAFLRIGISLPTSLQVSARDRHCRGARVCRLESWPHLPHTLLRSRTRTGTTAGSTAAAIITEAATQPTIAMKRPPLVLASLVPQGRISVAGAVRRMQTPPVARRPAGPGFGKADDSAVARSPRRKWRLRFRVRRRESESGLALSEDKAPTNELPLWYE